MISDSIQYKGCRVDISPTEKTPLAGWKHRTMPFDSIHDGLEANILAVTDSSVQIVFISVDTLYVSKNLKNDILANLLNLNGLELKEENIFIGATHTHFAPLLDKSKTSLGQFSPKYYQFVVEKIVSAITDLLKSQNCIIGECFFGKSNENLTVNRRRPRLKWIWRNLPELIVEIAPNPLSNTDNSINVIKFVYSNVIIAIIWNFACHPVNFYDHNSVSADYIGYVRKQIRLSVESDIPVVFFQGFSGNIRANNYRKEHPIKEKLNQIIGKKKSFEPFDKKLYNEWCNKLSDKVEKIINGKMDQIVNISLSSSIKKVPVSKLVSGCVTNDEIVLHKVNFNSSIVLCGISAELVVEYIPIIKKLLGENVICIGCIDSVFGYLPTDRMIIMGGYEVVGYNKVFNVKYNYIESPECLVKDMLSM